MGGGRCRVIYDRPPRSAPFQLAAEALATTARDAGVVTLDAAVEVGGEQGGEGCEDTGHEVAPGAREFVKLSLWSKTIAVLNNHEAQLWS